MGECLYAHHLQQQLDHHHPQHTQHQAIAMTTTTCACPLTSPPKYVPATQRPSCILQELRALGSFGGGRGAVSSQVKHLRAGKG